MNFLTINKQQFNDIYKYEFNSSLFDLNYNQYHILKLHLALIDQNENHILLSQPAIYCTLTRKSGKKCKFVCFSISTCILID
jgi:hypothetical protein